MKQKSSNGKGADQFLKRREHISINLNLDYLDTRLFLQAPPPPLPLSLTHTQAYLKEILREVCVYNTKAPHKNMWQLRPEYRHYQESTK